MNLVSCPSSVGRLFDSLVRRWPVGPEHTQTVAFVNDIVKQAVDMYLDQSRFVSEPSTDTTPLSGVDIPRSIIRVQHFIDTLQAFPTTASCEQVLIWASFVVASGCVLDEHVRFFEETFARHYARNGFTNVLIALETLRRSWVRNMSQRWTLLLSQTGILVM